MDFSLLFQNNFKMFLPEFFLATSILVITLHGSLVATSKILGFPLLLRSFNREKGGANDVKPSNH